MNIDSAIIVIGPYQATIVTALAICVFLGAMVWIGDKVFKI